MTTPVHQLLPYRLARHGRLLLIVVLALVGSLALPASTSAHPLGNFSVNRYSRVEATSSAINLLYIVDMAEIPAFQERARMDLDRDGVVSVEEQTGYLTAIAPSLQNNLRLQLDGREVPLEAQEQTLEFPEGQGGLQTLRLTLKLSAALPENQQPQSVTYQDTNYEGRLGWQEIVVQPGERVTILDSTAPATDISNELRAYPDELLQSPLEVSSASFTFRSGGPGLAEAGSAVTVPAEARSRDPFVALIEAPQLELVTILLALLAAFGWGAAHALTPGHGKTVVAAYLVGSRGTVGHALFLGLTTTITHTAGVFALGLVTLYLSQYILPEQLFPWLSLISGLLVVAIGFSMFGQRLRALLRGGPAGGSPEHMHSHDHGDHHSHLHDHGHSHSHDHLPPGAHGTPVTWRSLLALGISGGILPCPSALVVLLSAIALQRVGFGLLLIVAFSLGLASVLTGIGIALVHAGRLFERIPTRGRLVHALPVASALLITLAGVGITLQAVAQSGALRFITVASAIPW
jgi:nickel/cobalt transporter (NicO) family protein